MRSKLLSAAGAICFAVSVLFLNITVVAGLLSTAALVLLLCGGRCADTRSDVILNSILLWIGYSIRFCGLFGTQFIYDLLCSFMFIPYCALIAAVLCLDRRVRRSGHPYLSVLIIPALLAVCAYLLASLKLGFVTNIMGYAMCIPVVAANLSLLGEYGMTFVLMMILMCFAAIWLESRKRQKIFFASVSLLLSASLLVSGVILRGQYKEPDYTVDVALATSQEMDFTGENGIFYTEEQQLEMFSNALKKATEAGAKLLVLNEEYFAWEAENTETLLEKASQIVCQYGIPTLIGIDVMSDEELHINEAVYYDADGKILYTYVKNNLVPFVEAGQYEDGAEEPALLNVLIDGHSLELGFVICFDLDDSVYLRKIPPSTELLIVPSWDWDMANIEQKRTSALAASLGLTLVKHSFDGFSYVSCPNGDCTEQIDLRGCYETVTMVSVPVWEK